MKKIYGSVYEYAKKNILSFHMPGHKGKDCNNLLMDNAFMLDTTEIPGMDNLYHAEGIIKNSQEAAAELYGAKRSFFLTGGSTAGVLAAILSCVSDGDKILAARNCHKSVISGIMLSGAEPVFVYPEITDFKVAGGINPEKVKTALNENKNVRAVVIVSPTYEGIVSDVKRIAEITKRMGAYLIVDCAHGSHFPFSNNFPDYPYDADIVICGLHKTLPIFGQCALLNVNNPYLIEKAAAALAIVQTSSPSYLFLSSIDKFFSDFSTGFYNFDKYTENLIKFHSLMGELKRIRLIEKSLAGSCSVFDTDISRLVFLFEKEDAYKFAGLLHSKYSIDLEAHYPRHAIAISTVADTEKDLEKLAMAVYEIDCLPGAASAEEPPVMEIFKPRAVLTPRKARGMPAEYVDITECTGRVSAEAVLTYPPGIATVWPGEEINCETAGFLTYCVKAGITVHGLYGTKVLVLKEH